MAQAHGIRIRAHGNQSAEKKLEKGTRMQNMEKRKSLQASETGLRYNTTVTISPLLLIHCVQRRAC